MKNAAPVHCGGRNERVGDMLVNRLLPNGQIPKIGSFVYLGHVYPTGCALPATRKVAGSNAHPHRGIVTLSFLLDGSLRHRDSRGHQGTANRGDVLWLKAGNGIVHEEVAQNLHSLQFWINLPAIDKTADPVFRVLRNADIAQLELPNEAGWLRVILGVCGTAESSLPTFQNEFIYHIQLHPKSEFVYRPKNGSEHGLFIPHHEVQINDEPAENSQLIALGERIEAIRLYNPGICTADAILFGGPEYNEPYITEGPFVMSNRKEMAVAYRDFFEGRYGQLPNDPLT